MLVNLHILGVQKAGTTALASFLNQHPDIYVVDGKEAHVFDHPNFEQQQNKRAFANRKYKQRLTLHAHEPIICDATPITIYRPLFLRACVAYNPDAKFIVLLRDPVERAISHYQMSYKKSEESRSMLMAFIIEPLRLMICKDKASWPFDSPKRCHSYLSRGLYKKQLANLYAHVPRQNILVLQQNSLKNNHKQTLFKIFEFLDIPRAEVKEEVVFATQSVTNHWTDRLARLYAKLYFTLHNLT